MLEKQIRPAIVMTLAAVRHHGLHLSRRRHRRSRSCSFPRQANGSLVTVNGRVVGSALIGQPFTQPRVLPPAAVGGRRAATTPPRSAGTNKGPTDRKLADTLIARRVDSAVRTTAP